MDFFSDENLWFYLPLILWVSGIFYLSSNKGSFANTSIYISPILNFLFPETEADILKKYHLYFRKIFHFVGYAILALFASIAFYNSSAIFLANFWYIFAFVMVLFISSADEIKQSFYANRIGSIFDVMLDCVGGLTMILLILISTSTFFR